MFAAADAGEDAGDQQRPKRGGVIFKSRPDGEQNIGQRRTGGADEQNGTAAMMVGKSSPNRRENELHRGKRGDDGADDPAARAVMPAEDRHQRTTMPNPMRSMKTVRKTTSNDGLRFIYNERAV